MRRQHFLRVVTVAAAFLAAAPAFSQRLSLAERVAQLEQKSAMQSQGAGSANLDLQNRVTQLQSEVSSLRSLIEQMQNENEQLKLRGQQQYLDVDSRLARIEGGGAAAPALENSPSAPAVTAAEPEPVVAPAAAERAPKPTKPASADNAPSDPAAAEAAYAEALDALVQRYEAAESARMFQSFLQSYPDSALVPNAWYWLGESYYVTQNYELAAESFQTALDEYPGSRKEPDALLKLAYCQIALGQFEAAEAGLHAVISRYPDSDAAAKAQSRLQTLMRDGR